MQITDIRVSPVDDDKLKAFVTIVLDGCFVVCDIKIIQGGQGLFISMPSKRRKDGTFRDLAHPLNSETRQLLEEQILARYSDVLAAGVEPRRLRSPREAEEHGSERIFPHAPSEHDGPRPGASVAGDPTRPGADA